MEMSRKFIVLSLSVSAVKCNFGCSALKSFRMDWMSDNSGFKIKKFLKSFK